MTAYDIVIRPVITERSMNSVADKKYVFEVAPSAGKVENREESGYNIAWCTNLTPYNALLNTESMFAVKGCDSPAGARLFIRYVTGGADGESGGFKPFTKTGNWPLRDDFVDEKNPAKLSELGARANDLVQIYNIYPDVQDMWTFWRDQAPK